MWFKKTFSIFSLLFLIFNVQASILDSEVFKLLEENYQNYCKASKFTSDSYECQKSKRDHLLEIEKVTLINEALTLKKKKLSTALKKNIFAKKCFIPAVKSDHCNDIETIVIKYIDSLKTLSEVQNAYASECVNYPGLVKFDINEQCAKHIRPSIKIFSQFVRDLEIKNPFLTKLKKKISSNQGLYKVDHGREYEKLIKNQKVIDDVFDSINEIEKLLLGEFQKTKASLKSNVAEALVNDSIGLSTDQLILLGELSSLYFNEVSNPNLNPQLQLAKCQLQNKVLYEENWNNVGDFGIDIMLTIGSYGLGSTFFTKSAAMISKNKKIASGATLVLATAMPLEFEIGRAKKVMSKCESLDQQLLVEVDQSERVFNELKQCEVEAIGHMLSIGGNVLAFSAPLTKRINTVGLKATRVSKTKSSTPHVTPTSSVSYPNSSLKTPVAKYSTEILSPKPYELLKSGDKIVDVKRHRFLNDGPHVYLKAKDGTYFISPTLGPGQFIPHDIGEDKILSFLSTVDTPFVSTHRSLIRKFEIDLDDIVSAGEIHVSGGKVLNINNKSGTFKHGKEVLDEVGIDFGVPSNRLNPVNTSTQLKKHSKEHITAGLRKYFEGNESYQKVQLLKQRTAELLDKKGISYSELQKELEGESEALLKKLISGEPGISDLDLKRSSDVQKVYNYFIYNEEPEVYLLNMLNRSGGDNTETFLEVYESYLNSKL